MENPPNQTQESNNLVLQHNAD